jgi:hypothetical protein
MRLFKNKFLSSFLILSLMLVSLGIFPETTGAAALINAKDVMSTQATSATADHTLTWTLASGKTNAAGGKVTIDFVEADFVASGTYAVGDYQFSDNLRTNQAPVGVGTIASPATCTAGVNNYTVNTTIATSTFQIVFCPSWSTSSTGTNTFKIFGTSADGLLTNKASNVESSLITITNSVNDTDSTTLAAVVETNAVVTVTATVNPTLTLAISSNSVALNVISSSTTGSGSHTAQIATNGTGGFLLTYNGPTLTAPTGTIAAYGAQQSSVAGTAGFGINMVDNATPNIGANVTQNAGVCAALPANYGTVDKYSYVASTTTNLTNQAAPADCTYTVSYVANVSTVTPAGSYTAAITYVASATF